MKNVKKGDWFLCTNHTYSGEKGMVILECIKSYKTEQFARVVWADGDDIRHAAILAWTGTYPNHRIKYRAGRAVKTTSAVPLRRNHWENMHALRGDELARWKLLVDL